MQKRIRVLLAKIGCDIHERGALTMMNAFRDAGMEVIYTGRFQSEENVVRAAIEEDVDLIGVSDLSGSLPIISKKILTGLRENNADIPLICGGLMTDDDISEMLDMGVSACFETGSSIDTCVEKVFEIIKEK